MTRNDELRYAMEMSNSKKFLRPLKLSNSSHFDFHVTCFLNTLGVFLFVVVVKPTPFFMTRNSAVSQVQGGLSELVEAR